MDTWVNVNALFPGAKGIFFHVVDVEFKQLTETLIENRFEVITIDGQEVSNEKSFFEVAAKSFNFPGHFGRNWDAWTDCLGDFGKEPPSNRVAVIWRHADFTISNDLQVFLQALFDLSGLAAVVSHDSVNHQNSDSEIKQIEIFVLQGESRLESL